jgi:hypothetical protein
MDDISINTFIKFNRLKAFKNEKYPTSIFYFYPEKIERKIFGGQKPGSVGLEYEIEQNKLWFSSYYWRNITNLYSSFALPEDTITVKENLREYFNRIDAENNRIHLDFLNPTCEIDNDIVLPTNFDKISWISIQINPL